MSLFKLIFRSLIYYRKNHFAVFLGTLISTAILTGALIIGDSVKYSLGNLVDKRLGEIAFSMETGDRFITDELSSKLAQHLNIKTASVLMLNGISIDPASSNRINKTQVIGVDQNFWDLSGIKTVELKEDEAIISSNLALRLKLDIGDEFLLRVEKKSFIPSNAPFVKEDESSIALRLNIVSIADKDHLGRFSLKNNQVAPYNVYLSKAFLAEEIEISGYSNLVLIKNNKDQSLNVERLNTELKQHWTLNDAGLSINNLAASDQFELRSRRIFLEAAIAKPVIEMMTENEEVLSYLVNTLKSETAETPYSFVSALSSLDERLNENEIIINDWLAKDLNLKVKDSIGLDYFVIGPMRKLSEESKFFVVKEIIKTGENGIDNSLMPPFPGLATANSCNDWETGVPVDLSRIRDKDEDYWNVFKGTPKALISYKTAQSMWANRFGDHTALRFNSKEIGLIAFRQKVLEKIDPKELGLAFLAVREIGDLAVDNSISFGELFLSLSFFVIAAGILLTALLYSLSMEARKEESGILAACGFSKKKIRRIQLMESSIVAILGGFMGAGIGILYNNAIMKAINSVWIDIVRTNELEIYLLPQTLLIGALSGIIIALIVIYFISYKKLKQPIVVLIKKIITENTRKRKKEVILWLFAIVSLLGMLFLLAQSFSDSAENNASNFLMASALFLVSAFAFVKIYLNYLQQKTNSTTFTTLSLLLRNISLNQSRSMAVIILLALGAFTILITGSNRKTFYGSENNAQSGTGAYLFWVESSLPILNDLNSSNEFDTESIKNKNIRFVQFHQLAGDDASCLNLNQVNQPQILGFDPQAFDQKNAFVFANLHDSMDENKPWMDLEKSLGENIIPAFADQTVITWGLKMKIGDTLYYKSEAGETISMVLMGGLNPSIFQGNLLIADSHFTKYFPTVGGSRVLLVDAPIEQEASVRDYLNQNFTDFGIDIMRASDRLAEFNSVTNTYLTVFMILGGLGVLIGTVGLGIVLLRNMLDRRHEIALMQAMGFDKHRIFRIIFFENLVLLIAGMFIGLLSAFIGIMPSILSNSLEMQSSMMIIILAIIFINGLGWIYFTARSMMKSKMIGALQND